MSIDQSPSYSPALPSGLRPRLRPNWPLIGRFLLLTLVLVPATYPLWRQGMQATHDGIHHLARLYELDQMLRQGMLYPRWFPDMAFGYGFPVLHYYGGFIYYLGMGFRLLGWGYLATAEWVLALGIIASGWAMYLFARRWGERMGWLAALAYVYWPYHLANALVRGAQAELWAMVWYPLLLAATDSLCRPPSPPGHRSRHRSALILALGFGLLLFTHNISALMFTPVLLAYAMLIIWRNRSWSGLKWLTLGLAAGAALSAFFWLPALADIEWVRAAGLQLAAQAEYGGRLYPLSDLISPYWVHRYLPDQGTPTFHPIPRMAIILWLASAALMTFQWRKVAGTMRAIWLFFAAITLISLCFMHEISRPLWESLPGFAYLGPPYRFQGLVSFTGSLSLAVGLIMGLDALTATWTPPTRNLFRIASPLATILLLALASLPHLPQESMRMPGSDHVILEEDMQLGTIATFDYQIGLAAREWGGAWFYEYLPVWVAEAPTRIFLPPEEAVSSSTTGDLQVRELARSPLRRSYAVTSDQPWELSLHQFYFPPWQITIDDQPVQTYPRGPLALLSASIPAGYHNISIHWSGSIAQHLGTIIALIGTFLWLVLAWRWQRPWALTALLILVIIATLPWAIARLSPPKMGYTTQEVRLGDLATLIGSHLPKGELKPGERVWVELDWLAHRSPDTRTKVILHLEDGNGKMWANGDAEPGFYFTPTTRWLAGEIMEDTISVQIPDDAPPGRYRLLTGMYDADTVENLPISGGEQVGGRLLLGEIQVANP